MVSLCSQVTGPPGEVPFLCHTASKGTLAKQTYTGLLEHALNELVWISAKDSLIHVDFISR